MEKGDSEVCSIASDGLGHGVLFPQLATHHNPFLAALYVIANVFVWFAKCICLNHKMYLSIIQNLYANLEICFLSLLTTILS